MPRPRDYAPSRTQANHGTLTPADVIAVQSAFRRQPFNRLRRKSKKLAEEPGLGVMSHNILPDPDSVRLHGFQSCGIVESKRDSERVIKALQKEGVLSGPRRCVADLTRLDQALEKVHLGGWNRLSAKATGHRLSPAQRANVTTYLTTVKAEATRRAPILEKLQEIDGRMDEDFARYVSGNRVSKEALEKFERVQWELQMELSRELLEQLPYPSQIKLASKK